MLLVTGATGKVGTALVEQLQAQAMPFRALAHSPASYDRLKAQQIHAVLVPDVQTADLAAAFEGVDQLFLLTPTSLDQAAIEGALVDAAKQAGVRHIVKQSALGADDASVSIFGPHRESEEYLKQSGVGYTILRPNLFMQNLGTIDVATIKQQNAIFNSAGDGLISQIDVRDIAAVAIAAFTNPKHASKIYDLTGPEALPYSEVAQKLTTALVRTVQYVALNDNDYQHALVSAGLPDWYATGLSELYRFYRDGEAAAVTNTVEEVTGQPPRRLDGYLAENRALFG